MSEVNHLPSDDDNISLSTSHNMKAPVLKETITGGMSINADAPLYVFILYVHIDQRYYVLI